MLLAGPVAAETLKIDGLHIDGAPPPDAHIAALVDRYQAIKVTFANDFMPNGGGIIVAHRRHLGPARLGIVSRPGEAIRDISGDIPDFRPFATMQPGASGRYVLFVETANESPQIHAFDTKTGSKRALTSGSANDTPLWSADGSVFAFASTRADGKSRGIYVAAPDRVEEARALVADSKNWTPIDWSPDGRWLLASVRDGTGTKLHRIKVATGAMQSIEADIPSDELQFGARLSADGEHVFILSRHGEFDRVGRITVATGATQWIGEDIVGDVRFIVASPRRDVLAYVTFESGSHKLRLIEMRTMRPLANLAMRTDWMTGLAFSENSRRVLFSVIQANDTSDAYVWDRTTGRVERWTKSDLAGLDKNRFSDWHRFQYRTHDLADGQPRMISAAIVRPKAKAGRAPVVIYLRGAGGLFATELFPAVNEMRVNELGIALVMPHVRGSSGYGRTFADLDNGALRDGQVRDIGALLDWIETQPNLDPDRVMVMTDPGAGTAGSILAWQVLAEYGRRLRGGILSTGPVDLAAFVAKASPAVIENSRREYGDDRTTEGQALLARFSATAVVDRVDVPLLILQGGTSPRIPNESINAQIEKLRARGVPVWRVIVPDAANFRADPKASRLAEIYATQFIAAQVK